MANLPAIDIVGFAGAFLLVLAYLMVTTQKWKQTALVYHAVNFAATAMLLAYSLHKIAYANAMLNIVWLAVAVYGVWRWWKYHRKKPARRRA